MNGSNGKCGSQGLGAISQNGSIMCGKGEGKKEEEKQPLPNKLCTLSAHDATGLDDAC